jgi:hypothetical protein
MDAIVPKDLDEEIFNDRVPGLSAREIASGRSLRNIM